MNKKFEEEAKGEAYKKVKTRFKENGYEENRKKTFWYMAIRKT